MRPMPVVRTVARAAVARRTAFVAAAGIAAGFGAAAYPAVAGGSPIVELGAWFQAPACEGTICTTVSSDDLPRLEVRGRSFSANGEVLVGVYPPGAVDPDEIYEAFADTSGFFEVQTPHLDCAALPSPRAVAYEIRVLDLTSDRWSNVADATLCGPSAA